MRALAVQQRTVWHPGTVGTRSTLIPYTDPRVPEGCPSHSGLIRRKVGRDDWESSTHYYPVSSGTKATFSMCVAHDPNCVSQEHAPFRVLLISYLATGESKWLLHTPINTPPVSDWVFYQGFVGLPSTAVSVSAILSCSGLVEGREKCTWFVADDWITLTP